MTYILYDQLNLHLTREPAGGCHIVLQVSVKLLWSKATRGIISLCQKNLWQPLVKSYKEAIPYSLFKSIVTDIYWVLVTQMALSCFYVGCFVTTAALLGRGRWSLWEMKNWAHRGIKWAVAPTPVRRESWRGGVSSLAGSEQQGRVFIPMSLLLLFGVNDYTCQITWGLFS